MPIVCTLDCGYFKNVFFLNMWISFQLLSSVSSGYNPRLEAS